MVSFYESVGNVINFCFQILMAFLEKYDLIAFFLSAFFISMAYRFLLQPLVHGGGVGASDIVRKDVEKRQGGRSSG